MFTIEADNLSINRAKTAAVKNLSFQVQKGEVFGLLGGNGAGIANRDKAMGLVSLLSPPLLTERLLSRAAETNIAAFQRYDECTRNFHSSLREFHYSMLFGNVTYSQEHMTKLPQFAPCLKQAR